jgi:DUF1365 family protein
MTSAAIKPMNSRIYKGWVLLPHFRALSRSGGAAAAVRRLMHLRYVGYCMNPVSFYYCFSESGDRLEAIVAEITNTPWKERHQYVLAVGAGGRLKRFDFDKEFHVSPFLPMDMMYRWCFSELQERLIVNMQNFRHEGQICDATLALTQEPLSAAAAPVFSPTWSSRITGISRASTMRWCPSR